MTRWNLSIPEETDRAVRSFLARIGRAKKGELSDFVNEAVRREIFIRTVREIKDRNENTDSKQMEALIEEALEWSRARRF